MTKSQLIRLLAMIAPPDADPDAFDFVVNRIMAALNGSDSDD